MTPRMYDLIGEAHQHIGKYVLLKSDKTGKYRVDSVSKIGATLTLDGIVIDLLTLNGFSRQFNAYTKVFNSRKEAEDAATMLNTKGVE